MIRSKEWIEHLEALANHDAHGDVREVAAHVQSLTSDDAVEAYLELVLEGRDPHSRLYEVCREMLDLLHPEVTA